MDRAAISSHNRAAVEFVYMVEAETLTRDSGTRGLNDVKKLLHMKYIELIRQIPTNHFSEFGLREGMIDKYYGAKKGGASGFYTKVLYKQSLDLSMVLALPCQRFQVVAVLMMLRINSSLMITKLSWEL
jgi:hypothetical protein